jgi:hypothetical protein
MENKHSTSGSGERKPIMALPVALYESHGVIFELYEGGQEYKPQFIRWERLKTVSVTRHECEFSVDINQREREDLFPMF